jgi:superfamily II DNA helicase RecQ
MEIFGVTGLRLRDSGTWVISEVEGTYVVANNGDFTRRFEFGTKVETVGGQIGVLTSLPQGQDQTYVRAVDLLRELRSQLRHGRPAFTILHDRVLEAIASVQPRTRAELMAISGVGPAKLAAYGDAILAAIREATDVSQR